MGLRGSLSPGNDGHSHGAQALNQDVDRQHYDRMITRPGKARIPDVASERVHRLFGISGNHAGRQRSRLPRIERIVGGGGVHLPGVPVKQAQPLPD